MADNKAHTADNALAPGNFDKAWNDPPLFSYTGNAAAKSSRTNLNKRIAFPGMGGGAAPLPPPGMDPTATPPLYDLGCKPPAGSLPPPPPQCVPGTLPPPPQCGPVRPTYGQAVAKEEKTLSVDEVQAMFTTLVESIFDEKKSVDLLGRLSMMFKRWREGDLNPRVGPLLTQIGSSLEAGRIRDAETCFETLSADHGGAGGNSQWILAVRHLLTMAKEQRLEAEDTDAVTTPL